MTRTSWYRIEVLTIAAAIHSPLLEYYMVLDSNKIEEIWSKATEVSGYDSSRWRKDFAGAWIQREQYGLPTEFGWEIFHLIPMSKGGSNDVDNLLPIHRQNNLRRANDYPIFHTAITSNGNKNISEDQIWRIEQ